MTDVSDSDEWVTSLSLIVTRALALVILGYILAPAL